MSTLKKPSRRTMPVMLMVKGAGQAAAAKAVAGRAGNKSGSGKHVGGAPCLLSHRERGVADIRG